MNSAFSQLRNDSDFKYLRERDLRPVRPYTIDIQQFQNATLLDYRQAVEIAKSASAKISELESLAHKRQKKHETRIKALSEAIGGRLVKAWAIMGTIGGLAVGAVAGGDWIGVGVIIGAIVGFVFGFGISIIDSEYWKR